MNQCTVERFIRFKIVLNFPWMFIAESGYGLLNNDSEKQNEFLELIVSNLSKPPVEMTFELTYAHKQTLGE